MTLRTTSSCLLVTFVLGCGGAAPASPSTARSSARPLEAESDTIAIDRSTGIVQADRFDDFSSLFSNAAGDALELDPAERGAMPQLGLDPESAADRELLAFVLRGSHYRFQARKMDGDRRDLGIYVYNLRGVRVGEPIRVLDATALEGIEPNEVGDVLHQIFDPVRESGEPCAIVAYAKDRSREPAWRRGLFNVLAESAELATSGTFRFTRAIGGDGRELDVITHPSPELRALEFVFQGERYGHPWRVAPDGVPLRTAG